MMNVTIPLGAGKIAYVSCFQSPAAEIDRENLCEAIKIGPLRHVLFICSTGKYGTSG
jgi:hypothetical protein